MFEFSALSKLPQIEINNLDDAVNFSQVSEEEKKEFVEKIMSKQIGFVQRCLLCFDCAEIIVDLFKKIHVNKVYMLTSCICLE